MKNTSQDDDVPTLYTRNHNHYHAHQHNKKARHHYNRPQQDTNFQHKVPIEGNHPAAQFINQIPPKANYSPRTYNHSQSQVDQANYITPHQGQPKLASQRDIPHYAQQQYNPKYVGPTPQQLNSKYAGSPPLTYTPMHPTYTKPPSQHQFQHTTPTSAVVQHEAFPLHYQNSQGYPSSYPDIQPMYQYAQRPHQHPEPQQYLPQQHPQSHQHQHNQSTHKQSNQGQPTHQQKHRPMVPINNQYLPSVHNSQTSRHRPVTQFDRSAFYVEEQPANNHDNPEEWNSQNMETFLMPTYAPDPSNPMQHQIFAHHTSTPMQHQMPSMQATPNQPQDQSSSM